MKKLSFTFTEDDIQRVGETEEGDGSDPRQAHQHRSGTPCNTEGGGQMSFEISKSIPLPPRGSGSRIVESLRSMDIGDSIVVPRKKTSVKYKHSCAESWHKDNLPND